MNAKTQAKEPELLKPTKNNTKIATIEESAALTPMALLQQATASGADVDQLQKLMELQERWEAGEAKKAYVAAMMDFQAECPFIDKLRDGHNSKYANLADTLKQIKSLMKTHGFVHSWKTMQMDGLLTVTCCVTHKDGHQECSSMTAGADTSGNKNDVQAIGSTNTYLQRYTLFSVLGLAAADQDKDGDLPAEVITLDQETILNDLLEETKINKDDFLLWAKVDSMANIPASLFDKALQELNAKKKAAKTK